MSQVKSTRITVVKGKNLSINRRLAVITVACIAPTSGWGRGGSARAARPMYKSGLFQDGVIHLMIESDALQSNARNLQGSSRIQLTCFVRVLRRYVLPARERLLDYSLRCLRNIHVKREKLRIVSCTSVESNSHSCVVRSSMRNALYVPA